MVDFGGEDFGRVGADVAEGVAQTLVEGLGENDGKVMAVVPAAGMAVVMVVVGGEANRDISESVAHGKVEEEEKRETESVEKESNNYSNKTQNNDFIEERGGETKRERS